MSLHNAASFGVRVDDVISVKNIYASDKIQITYNSNIIAELPYTYFLVAPPYKQLTADFSAYIQLFAGPISLL